MSPEVSTSLASRRAPGGHAARGRDTGRPYDVTVVTAGRRSPDADQHTELVHALIRRNLRVRSAVWSDQQVDWSQSSLTVVRAAVELPQQEPAFRRWLGRADAVTHLMNSAEAVLWNLDKRRLAGLGVATVPTRVVDQGQRGGLIDPMRELGTTDIVIKPVLGARGFGVRRFDLSRGAVRANRHARRLMMAGDILIQPYQAAVESGGVRSLVFLGGVFSHAFRAPCLWGPQGEDEATGYDPTEQEIAFAEVAVALSLSEPSFARVDLIAGKLGPVLMDLKMGAGDLRLGADGGGMERFVDQLQLRLWRMARQRGERLSCC